MDRVQIEEVAIAGYLVGLLISEVTAYNLAEQISSSGIFKANKLSQVDIFEDFIAIHQSNNRQNQQKKR